MRNRFIGIISLCMVLSLFAGCGSVQAKDSGNKETSEAAQSEQDTPEVVSAQQDTPEVTQQAAEGEETMTADEQTTPEVVQEQEFTQEAVKGEEAMLQMTIGGTPVEVEWEDNESVEALRQLCREEPLTIQMSMYGGFEQVGSIGQRLPRNDSQTTTQSGDIVLYSGDQIVVFYGSNSWAYTRLGHVTDKSDEEMAQMLGNGDVTITVEMK